MLDAEFGGQGWLSVLGVFSATAILVGACLLVLLDLALPWEVEG